MIIQGRCLGKNPRLEADVNATQFSPMLHLSRSVRPPHTSVHLAVWRMHRCMKKIQGANLIALQPIKLIGEYLVRWTLSCSVLSRSWSVFEHTSAQSNSWLNLCGRRTTNSVRHQNTRCCNYYCLIYIVVVSTMGHIQPVFKHKRPLWSRNHP